MEGEIRMGGDAGGGLAIEGEAKMEQDALAEQIETGDVRRMVWPQLVMSVAVRARARAGWPTTLLICRSGRTLVSLSSHGPGRRHTPGLAEHHRGVVEHTAGDRAGTKTPGRWARRRRGLPRVQERAEEAFTPAAANPPASAWSRSSMGPARVSKRARTDKGDPGRSPRASSTASPSSARGPAPEPASARSSRRGGDGPGARDREMVDG